MTKLFLATLAASVLVTGCGTAASDAPLPEGLTTTTVTTSTTTKTAAAAPKAAAPRAAAASALLGRPPRSLPVADVGR